MRTSKIYLFFTLVTTVTLTSCNDFLDQQPDDRTELNSPVKVAELLATAYPKANYIPFTEAMSDNAGDKGTTSRDLENSLPWTFQDNVSVDEDTPNYYWQGCYKAIAAANHALETINNATDKKAYSASKGEALVARAYSHFMLVTLFAKAYDPATAASDAGIPYVTTPEKVVDRKYERNTVAYVYEQIEKDLLEGLPLLNNNSYRVPKYHFTIEAAHAFATRFYLFKREYAKVVEHANEVMAINLTTPNLRAWNSIYTSATYNDLRAIYTRSTEASNLLLVEAPTSWGRSFPSYNYGLNTIVLNTVLGNNNPLGVALIFRDNVYGGTEVVYNIPKFKEHFVKQNISDNFGIPYNMIPLLTLEEVLFNRAEANAMLDNNNDVVNELNNYLSTRIPDYNPANPAHQFTVQKATDYYEGMSTKEALVSTILNFKQQEYMHEGLRWFDILRHKLPVEHTSFDGKTTLTLTSEDPRKIQQLPKEAIANGLASNPR